MRFLFLDTETGGIGLDKSLLQAYFMVCDYNLKEIDTLMLELKPNDNVYHIDGNSCKVNNIVLQHHHENAITYKEGGTKLFEFLTKNREFRNWYVPVGHGITRDIDQITDKLVSRGTWENFCSTCPIDTISVARILQHLGKLPIDCLSLVDIYDFFQNEKVCDFISHTADGDVIMNKIIFHKMLELFKND